MSTVLVAYAPGPGHYNTLVPLVEDLAVQPDCQVHLCGSLAVAHFADTAPHTVTHQPAGDERYPPPRTGLCGDELIRQMGHRSRTDITRLIDELHPDLLICDTSERGAVLAAHDRRTPFLRVVSCADAATTAGSAEETRRRGLIRGHDIDDLASPLNLGTVAFGPRWYFTGSEQPQEPLRCYRYRPPTPSTPMIQPSPERPRALISFGTFITEPTATMLEHAVHGLIDAGIKSISIKIRDDRTRAILREFAEYLGARTGSVIDVRREMNLSHHLADADLLLCHGSATSTLEALYQHVTPVIAASHNDAYFVARQCLNAESAITIDWATGFTRRTIRAAATTALHSPRIAAGIRCFTSDNDALPAISSLTHHLTQPSCKAASFRTANPPRGGVDLSGAGQVDISMVPGPAGSP